MSVAKNWARVKEIICEGLSPTQARHMNVILENTLREHKKLPYIGGKQALFENASGGTASAGSIAALNQVVLPLIRRVMPGVISQELVGVQPMDGPFGQIHTARMVYSNTSSGVNAGSEVFAPIHVNDLAVAYSGNEDTSSPAAATTAQLEGVPGNAAQLEVLKQQVTVGSRKLSAAWTIETATDAQSQHGMNYQEEIMDGTAKKIVQDIDQEILRVLRALPPTATAANTFDQAALSGSATFVGDEFAVLAIMILREANDIGQRTRIKPGNFIVVSTDALTMLTAAKSSAFAQTTQGEFDGAANMSYVGTLNNSQKVYLDIFASSDTPVLVGLKESDTNAGVYYCPYVPLMASEPVQDPNTFDYRVGLMSRYAVVTLENTATSLGNSADYYGSVGINAGNLQFY